MCQPGKLVLMLGILCLLAVEVIVLNFLLAGRNCWGAGEEVMDNTNVLVDGVGVVRNRKVEQGTACCG